MKKNAMLIIDRLFRTLFIVAEITVYILLLKYVQQLKQFNICINMFIKEVIK